MPVRQVLRAAGGHDRAVIDAIEFGGGKARHLAQAQAVAVGADDGLLAVRERSGCVRGVGGYRGVEQDRGEQRPGQEQAPK